MRTTIDIEEDVLLAAKEIARQRGVTLGRALSELARKSLTRTLSLPRQNGLPRVRPHRFQFLLEHLHLFIAEFLQFDWPADTEGGLTGVFDQFAGSSSTQENKG